ncbi:MAG: plasmid mobilization relaxosome protein MobC, partial [Bacteroidota bacterium]
VMARPQKSITDKRSAFLPHIRCTPSEKVTVAARAGKAGVSISEFVRSMAINGDIIVKHSKADFALIYELRKIGNNLNQLTHLAHSTGKFSPELEAVYQRLNDLLDQAIQSIDT